MVCDMFVSPIVLPVCSQSLHTPASPRKPLINSHYDVVFSRISYKGGHAVFDLLCLFLSHGVSDPFMLLHLSVISSFPISIIWIGHCLFVQSVVVVYFASGLFVVFFFFVAIMNKAAMNKYVQVFG